MAERTHYVIWPLSNWGKLDRWTAVCGQALCGELEYDAEWTKPGERFELPISTIGLCRACLKKAPQALEVLKPYRIQIALVRQKAVQEAEEGEP